MGNKCVMVATYEFYIVWNDKPKHLEWLSHFHIFVIPFHVL